MCILRMYLVAYTHICKYACMQVCTHKRMEEQLNERVLRIIVILGVQGETYCWSEPGDA